MAKARRGRGGEQGGGLGPVQIPGALYTRAWPRRWPEQVREGVGKSVEVRDFERLQLPLFPPVTE